MILHGSDDKSDTECLHWFNHSRNDLFSTLTEQFVEINKNSHFHTNLCYRHSIPCWMIFLVLIPSTFMNDLLYLSTLNIMGVQAMPGQMKCNWCSIATGVGLNTHAIYIMFDFAKPSVSCQSKCMLSCQAFSLKQNNTNTLPLTLGPTLPCLIYI